MKISKIYHHLNLRDRASYLFDLEVNGDEIELDRLWASVPRRRYEMPDLGFTAYRDAIHDVVQYYGIERWRLQALLNTARLMRIIRSREVKRTMGKTEWRVADRKCAKLEQLELYLDQSLAGLEQGLDELASCHGFSAASVRTVVGVTRHAPLPDSKPDKGKLEEMLQLSQLFDRTEQ